MALRNQPYLPLYVDDFLADEKLSLCSAEATGVYIRIMCLMHKSDEYGSILLKQKFKQSGEQVKDFASQLARQLPYTNEVVSNALNELIEFGVVKIDGDKLIQKRMQKDGKLSDTRASAGSKGGKASQKNKRKICSSKKASKKQANAVNGIVIETETVNEYEDVFGEYGEYGWVKLTPRQIERMTEDFASEMESLDAGADEVSRCIHYVDELAQSTGNKNKWKDWNLVVRRCHRERWGAG